MHLVGTKAQFIQIRMLEAQGWTQSHAEETCERRGSKSVVTKAERSA